MKAPRLMRDWIGLKVKLRRNVETKGGEKFAAGTVFKVRGVGHVSGFILETIATEDAPARCLNGVPRLLVELIV